MEDPLPTDEESSEDQESSDEEMEDPVPTAEQKKHASKVERKNRSERKRIVVFTGRRTPRTPVAGPSECKPLVTAPPTLVWGQTRQRSKRQEDEYSYKKSCEPAPPIKSEGLPTEQENTKTPEPGNEGLPQRPELQSRSKWHYKMHMIQKLQTSRTSAQILPAEVENTKTREPGTEGLPQSPEFPELQFRSKGHYKLHKIQELQTSRTSEPSPKNVEESYLQAHWP